MNEEEAGVLLETTNEANKDFWVGEHWKLGFLSVVLKHGLGGWFLDEMNNEIRVVIDETRKKQRLQIVKWRSGSNLS